MPVIKLQIEIRAEIQICFDLARSIDLHKISLEKTNETAIAGTTSGLINFGEFVTWEAMHFGFRQRLTSEITAFRSPKHFRDEQVNGIFEYLIHDHYFEEKGMVVLMTDIFNYQAPLGFLGSIAETLFLTRYLTRLLTERNNIIKQYAETDQWKAILE